MSIDLTTILADFEAILRQHLAHVPDGATVELTKVEVLVTLKAPKPDLITIETNIGNAPQGGQG